MSRQAGTRLRTRRRPQLRRGQQPSRSPLVAWFRTRSLYAILQGLIMILLGFLAIGEPMIASVAVVRFAG